MHIGHTISAMFAESGKKKVDFADRHYKNILAVHRQLAKPHMNTHIVCQYADFTHEAEFIGWNGVCAKCVLVGGVEI